ncbi:unnamed protein product [Arctia plantaginis]|uniref:Gamma-interferon-inducible lysosomal thiol reductase n=1 Tax=Arctia plantaginis TaxID=874455 RepID=A0A8S0ZY76_ARCPL|nr:unnamed protein product [Arctia plantaginis]CAB3240551.1 unnamed protein product [Arctia plantaginis]
MCLPQLRDDTLDTDLLTTDTVQETSTTPYSMDYSHNKVQLTVFYETHCPFSVDFFVEQLKPAVLKLGSHLELYTVPYGLAETNDGIGDNTISCHHGPSECHGNMVHACVLNHVKNKTLAVLYNCCLMSTTNDYTNTDITQCGLAEKVPVLTITNIIKCVNGTSGSLLLKSYGEVTKSNRIFYVPHLVFDQSSVYEDSGRTDLIGTVCGMLYPRPDECPKNTKDYYY